MPNFLQGGSQSDMRGTVSFINDFVMDEVKRLYFIENADFNVRAWQGHKVETKWFIPIFGSFKIVVVKPDSWIKPSANLEVKEFVLSANNIGVLHVPAGHATGFQSIEPRSKMMAFSDFTLEQSKSDDYRFDHNLWYNWT